jgi:hypothetical protein
MGQRPHGEEYHHLLQGIMVLLFGSVNIRVAHALTHLRFALNIYSAIALPKPSDLRLLHVLRYRSYGRLGSERAVQSDPNFEFIFPGGFYAVESNVVTTDHSSTHR